jgi:hypothetical protein
MRLLKINLINKNTDQAQLQWLMPIILAIPDAGTGRIMVGD